jgi:hypothetical protein
MEAFAVVGILTAVSIAGIVGTVRLVFRDGYRRRPCEAASSAPARWR